MTISWMSTKFVAALICAVFVAPELGLAAGPHTTAGDAPSSWHGLSWGMSEANAASKLGERAQPL